MSVENVKAFFEKAGEDQGLQQKLQALAEAQRQQGKSKPDDTDVAELVKLAAEAGYEFSAADWAASREALSEMQQYLPRARRPISGLVSKIRAGPFWASQVCQELRCRMSQRFRAWNRPARWFLALIPSLKGMVSAG